VPVVVPAERPDSIPVADAAVGERREQRSDALAELAVGTLDDAVVRPRDESRLREEVGRPPEERSERQSRHRRSPLPATVE